MASIVFAGTPAFAAAALARLLGPGAARGARTRFEVRAVLTQPDRPAGRGQKTVASPVKQLALARGLPVLQPATLKEGAGADRVAAFEPDYLVVASYGLILPPVVLGIARKAPLNIHASLLPRWRGAAPIVRAIEHGDERTGICIMRMETGLDTGPVCLRREIMMDPDDTAGSLHDRLAALGAEAITAALDGLEAGTLGFVPQSAVGITYAHKVGKSEAVVDWHRPADQVAARIRAFDPAPGSTGRLASAPDVPLRLFRPRVVDLADLADPAADPGEVVSVSGDGLMIACGGGAIVVGEMQRPGGRRLPAAAYLAGSRIEAGDRFVAASASVLRATS